ncbi:MAG: PQQ-binding-like beta-propeller repeat protein [Myxococcota bacterium]
MDLDVPRPLPVPVAAGSVSSAGSAEGAAGLPDQARLVRLLSAPGTTLPLPALTELTAGVASLARGAKRKVLLPVAAEPVELALLRRGPSVSVSAYEIGAAPEVLQQDHEVALEALLAAAAAACAEHAEAAPDAATRSIRTRIAERAGELAPTPDPWAPPPPTVKRGGAQAPGRGPLAFGFEARIPAAEPNTPARGATRSGAARADVHALLFDGELWAFVRGRRLLLGQGPIFLPVQRMVVALRALLDAWVSGRGTTLRLRAGHFIVGLRYEPRGETGGAVELRLGSRAGELRAAALEVTDVARPVLAVADALLRALVSADRTQRGNLRVTALRDEVRALRRVLADHARQRGFVNADPEALRASAPPAAPAPNDAPPVAASARWEERWRVDLEGLDASAVWFCGDRLVVATPQHTVALGRSDGDVLWARAGGGVRAMVGAALLRQGPDGELEVCDVRDGEPRASALLGSGGPLLALGGELGGKDAPPMALLSDDPGRLVAVDLRTGEPRWRFAARRGRALRACRAGRVLLVAEAGALHALDVATGEAVWRYPFRGEVAAAPVIAGEVAVVLTRGARPALHAVDLYSGEPLWRALTLAPPQGHPVGTPEALVVPVAGDRLVAYAPDGGEELWDSPDPGLAAGAATLVVDALLVTNAPGGCVAATQLTDGATRWSHVLGDPVGDDVPRRLEPVLRAGGLFVPGGGLHVLRPDDGERLAEVPVDLVPDRVRVDERGWVYVAEESGSLAAFAPAPTLRLVR